MCAQFSLTSLTTLAKKEVKIKPSLQDRSFNWYKNLYNVMSNSPFKLVLIEDVIFYGVRSPKMKT